MSEKYIELITTEHGDKPKFVEMVQTITTAIEEIGQKIEHFPQDYDLDTAIGNQLDVIGIWVGISRYLKTPIEGTFFSFDIQGVGFDEGVWYGPFDISSELTRLPDEFYRLVIKVRILNNHWNGTKAQMYEFIQTLFAPYGYFFFIDDNADLSINLGLVGMGPPTALLIALLTGGGFDIKPAGIRIRNYMYQSINAPIFAFDMNTAYFAGFDAGGWATLTQP